MEALWCNWKLYWDARLIKLKIAFVMVMSLVGITQEMKSDGVGLWMEQKIRQVDCEIEDSNLNSHNFVYKSIFFFRDFKLLSEPKTFSVYRFKNVTKKFSSKICVFLSSQVFPIICSCWNKSISCVSFRLTQKKLLFKRLVCGDLRLVFIECRKKNWVSLVSHLNSFRFKHVRQKMKKKSSNRRGKWLDRKSAVYSTFSHADDETTDEHTVWQHQVTFFSFPLEWLAEISSHCCQTVLFCFFFVFARATFLRCEFSSLSIFICKT